MALSRTKTWIAGEVLTASDLNAEFNNILNNPMSLISPFTGAADFDGQTITLDAAAATQVVSSAAVSWNFTSGAKTGTPSTSGSVERFSAQTFTDSNTAGSGTATVHVFYSIAIPTLAATNTSVTTTDAATWYIAGQPAAGTNETITNAWGLWVDAGNVRFDDDIHWLSGQTFAQRGILAHANTGVRTYTFPDASATIATLASKLSDFAATTSAELLGVISDETGTGALVFANTPTLVTPVIGAATGTSLALSGDVSGGSVSGNFVASQAAQEAGSNTSLIVTPGRQHFHPSSAKAWVRFNSSGTVAASYNITSITDTGAGDWTVNIATDFSSANYCGVVFIGQAVTSQLLVPNVSTASGAGSFAIASRTSDGVLNDPAVNEIYAALFGDL